MIPFALTRGIILAAGLIFEWLLETGVAAGSESIGTAPLSTLSAIFDANWYAGIAAGGYDFAPAAGQVNYHFFPLFAFLMRLSGDMVGVGGLPGGYNLAGVVLSHLFFLLALALLYKLTEVLTGDRMLATRTVWVAAALLWAFVFSMAYTESLFLALSVAAALYAYTYARRLQLTYLWLAGILAALATLTRPQGILVALLVFALSVAAPNTFSFPRRIRDLLVAACPSILVLLSFVLFVAQKTGDPLAIIHSSTGWGLGWYADFQQPIHLPVETRYWVTGILETAALLCWVALTILLLTRFRFRGSRGSLEASTSLASLFGWTGKVWLLYACSFLALTLLSNPSNGGWGRYLSVVFPCLWLIASANISQTMFRRLIGASLCLQVALFAAAVFLQVTP